MTILFIIIYSIGYFIAYYFSRKISREDKGAKYDWWDVVSNLFISFGSFCSVMIILLIKIAVYFDERDYSKLKNIKLPKPPNFL